MKQIIDFSNTLFEPLIQLGAAPLMAIILTIIALLFKVKFSKALRRRFKISHCINRDRGHHWNINYRICRRIKVFR